MLCNKLSPEKDSKVILLIIDPQNDFHEGGSLAVPGSTPDAANIANMIRDNIFKIDEIYVTLDSHNKMHIAHSAFWSNTEEDEGGPEPFGPGPPSFSQLMHDDASTSTALYTVTPDGGLDFTQGWYPKNSEYKEWCKEYSRKLVHGPNAFRLIIWPEHCLIGTPGNAVRSDINEALQEWAEVNHTKTIKYVPKGMNNLTEMYSVFEAEVPMSPSVSGGSVNVELLNALSYAEKLLVCGQAKSHCVNYSVRDLVKYWYNKPLDGCRFPSVKAENIILLTDAMSSVLGFEAAGEKFIEDMKTAGLSTSLSIDLKL